MKLIGGKHPTTSFSAHVYYAKSIQAQTNSKQASTGNLDATGTLVRGGNNTVLTHWAVGRNHSALRRKGMGKSCQDKIRAKRQLKA